MMASFNFVFSLCFSHLKKRKKKRASPISKIYKGTLFMLSLTNFVAFNSFHLQYTSLNKILFRACRKDGSYGPG